MANFNFGSISSVSSSNSNFIKPFTISQVKFTSAEVKEIAGKDGKKYNTIDLKFSGENGDYTDTYFIPANTDESLKRTEGQWGPQPSQYDHFVAYISHVMGALNPEGWAKLCEIGEKIKTFNDMAKAFVKLLQPAVGKEVTLRVIGRKYDRQDGSTGWAATTNHFLGAINRQGEFYVAGKKGFLNNKAEWTDREKTLKAEYDSYSPTKMAQDGPASIANTKGSEDLTGFNLSQGASSEDVVDLLGNLG